MVVAVMKNRHALVPAATIAVVVMALLKMTTIQISMSFPVAIRPMIRTRNKIVRSAVSTNFFPRRSSQRHPRWTSSSLSSVADAKIATAKSSTTTRDDHTKEDILHPKSSSIPKQNSSSSHEWFSVAPMMAHTTRYYRYFWRIFSHQTTLYTEMIPSSSIVNAYRQDVKNLVKFVSVVSHHDGEKVEEKDLFRPQNIARYVSEIQSRSSSSISMLFDLIQEDTTDGKIVLQLGGRDPQSLKLATMIACCWRSPPQPSSSSSLPSSAYSQFAYSAINLNCGCPSTSVSSPGRGCGAALMLEPEHVVQCLNAMTEGINTIINYRPIISDSTTSAAKIVDDDHAPPPILTLKHRLGVEDAATYQSRTSNNSTDTGRNEQVEEAYERCFNFLWIVLNSPNANHDLKRIQVHSRYALLGLDRVEEDNGDDDDGRKKASTTAGLWVPQEKSSSMINKENLAASTTIGFKKSKKIDHSRVQYRAKQQARQATVANRSIPPLLPEVAERIAKEFGHQIEVVTNGGIASIEKARQRGMVHNLHDDDNDDTGDDIPVSNPYGRIHGVMVGRAAINHPCAFSDIDLFLSGGKTSRDRNDAGKTTRRDVLRTYCEYCDIQELNMKRKQLSHADVMSTRRSLVAPVYHILAGEDGSDSERTDEEEDQVEDTGSSSDRYRYNPNAIYQRCLKKLMSRPQRHRSGDAIRAAISTVDDAAPPLSSRKPTSSRSSLGKSLSLDKPLSDHVPIHVINERQSAYSHLATKRSGTFQKMIH